MNKARNLMRYLTVCDNGPHLPGAPLRVFRMNLWKMGMFCAKTKKLLKAERSKPYIRRRMLSYCRRRVSQLDNGLPKRPRAWTDATFVKKWTTWG